MPTVEDANPIETLPSLFSGFAATIAAAAGSVAVPGSPLLRPGGVAPIWCVPSARMALRLFVSRTTKSVIFFFFTREGPEYVVMDVQTSAEIVPRDADAPALRPESMAWQVRYPSFFLDPTPDACARFAPPDAPPDETILCRLGADDRVLGVHVLDGAKTRRRPRIRFTRGGVIQDTLTPPYPLEPFLLLLETFALHTALGDGLESVQRTLTNESGDDVHTVVGTLVRAYRDAYMMVAAAPPPIHPALRNSAYELVDYRADLRIRLQEDGSLATGPDDERQALHATIAIGGTGDVGVVRLGPPPVITSGPRFESFFAHFSALDDDPRLMLLLGASHVLSASLYAESARQHSLLIHLGADDGHLVHLVYMRGILAERPMTLVFEAELDVDGDVVTWVDTGRLIARFGGQPPTVDRSSLELLFGLLANVRRWPDLI